MEHMALFVWLSLCLLLGAVIHYVMASALSHRVVRLLAAPGILIRKFTMTLTALACGATVTRVSIYELSERDIDFQGDGLASISKVLVPLAPLFGCAAAMVACNSAFGNPLNFEHSLPALQSLDRGGMKGFVAGTWALLSGVVKQGTAADWDSFSLYVLFALAFSFALGAASPIGRIKEILLGAALLSVAIGLLASLSLRRGSDLANSSPGWFTATRTFVLHMSAAAFAMMVYGLLTALVVGIVVRVYELITKAESTGGSKRASLKPNRQKKRAA